MRNNIVKSAHSSFLPYMYIYTHVHEHTQAHVYKRYIQDKEKGQRNG